MIRRMIGLIGINAENSDLDGALISVTGMIHFSKTHFIGKEFL